MVVDMQYSAYRSDHTQTDQASKKDMPTDKQTLPILPGMADAEDQAMKINLPETVIQRLRRWE